MSNISYTIICALTIFKTAILAAGAGVGTFPEYEGNEQEVSILAGEGCGVILEPKILFSPQEALNLEFSGEIAYEKKETKSFSDDDSFVDQGFSRIKRN